MLGNCSKTYLIFLMCLVGNFDSRYVLIKISKRGIDVEEEPKARMSKCECKHFIFSNTQYKNLSYLQHV